MRILRNIAIIIAAIVAWAIFNYFGVTGGFLLSPFSSGDSPESFVTATQEEIEKQFVGNLAMVLLENGQVAKQHFYSAKGSIDENSVFQVASVSKWVTSWGVMALVAEGKLDLDTPIDHYLTRWHLPPSDFDNSKVTARRLLAHSSGLIDDLGYDGFGPDEKVQTLEESLTKAADSEYSEGVARVGYEPGSQYMYSGAAYTLLQLVIEELSGTSFQEYMTQTVFEPLGMTNSTFVLADKPGLPLAPLYNGDGDIVPPGRFTALAAASLFTSVADLSRFMKANVNANPVLSKAIIEEMIQPQTYIGNIAVYGMGPHLYSQNDTGSLVFGHDGSGGEPAINTAARIDYQSKDGIIVLETGNYRLGSQIADEWLFQKAGIADFVVIQRNKSRIFIIFGTGVFVIIGLLIFGLRRKSPKKT